MGRATGISNPSFIIITFHACHPSHFRLAFVPVLTPLLPTRGRDGDEAHDYGYNFTNTRRRSNSISQTLGDFKTKFEAIETEPVFEEELHGPAHEEDDKENLTLNKAETSDSSTTAGSVEEEGEVKKM